MNRRQKIIVSVTGIFLVLLLLVGLTYAYFLTRITGNTNDKSISVSTANLAIVYGNDDGSVIGSGEKITPGTTFEPKTFTVTNQGNANTDYVVVIEEANVTYAETIEVDGVTQTKDAPTTFESNDFTYTLTCESGCNSVQEPTVFPIEGGILVGNRLDVGETQTYSFALTYNETGENQSNDMNKKLEAKINIKDITTINPYSDKPNTLAYNIINNAVALTNEEKSLGYAELVGTPYSKVAEETDGKSGTSYEGTEEFVSDLSVEQQAKGYITYALSYTFNPETSLFSLVNPQVCKYNESNCVSDLIAAGEDVYLVREGVQGNFSTQATIRPHENLVSIYRLVQSPSASETKAITLKTKRITKQPESVISTTADEYGTSYYYRGAVKNNYVNFNRMCWRIVRIEGDGSVRMILADKDAECSEETLTKTDSSIIGRGSYAYNGSVTAQEYSYDYLPPLQDEDGYGAYDPEVHWQYTTHLKYVYNIFLNGGTIEYTEDGEYAGDGTDVVLTQEFAGFAEESLEMLKSQRNCIGNKNKTYKYNGGGIGYRTQTFHRLYEDKSATLLCDGEDYTEPAKIFPLTIDEVILAGGLIDHPVTPSYNNSFYLRENAMTDWWLLSYSGSLSEKVDLSSMFYFTFNNNFIQPQAMFTEFKGIRPVISLIQNIELTSGDGSITNPYVIG